MMLPTHSVGGRAVAPAVAFPRREVDVQSCLWVRPSCWDELPPSLRPDWTLDDVWNKTQARKFRMQLPLLDNVRSMWVSDCQTR